MRQDFEHDFRDQRTQLTASAVLAKEGVDLNSRRKDSAALTVNDLLADRNECRRLVNKLRAGADAPGLRGDGEAIDKIIDDMNAINAITSRIQHQLDAKTREDAVNGAFAQAGRADQWRSPNGRRLNVLHNAADIAQHYAGKGNRDATAQIGVDDFLRGVAGLPTTQDVRAALSVGTDSAGGHAVPDRVMEEILQAMVPASSLLTAGAGIVPLDRDNAATFTTAAVDTVPTAAWRNENAAVAESDPAFRGVVATPRSLAFYFKVSRELLMDAPNIEGALRTAIAQAFAKELDRAGLRGTGTAPEPRGILNTSGIQAVTNGANGLALGGYANFLSAVQALLVANAPMPTAAIMAPRSLTKLAGLLDTTNQPLRVPPLLEPMRMIATSQIPVNLTVGTSTDCSEIYVGDFSLMHFALRENVSVQVSRELFATTGQLAFVCHVRADVVVQYPAAFAVVTGVRA